MKKKIDEVDLGHEEISKTEGNKVRSYQKVG